LSALALSDDNQPLGRDRNFGAVPLMQ